MSKYLLPFYLAGVSIGSTFLALSVEKPYAMAIMFLAGSLCVGLIWFCIGVERDYKLRSSGKIERTSDY